MKFTTTALFGLTLLCSSLINAQVGINTTTPAGVLDIKASNRTTPSHTDGILIPRVQKFPTTSPTSDQDGMLLFLDSVDGTNQRGFYFWDDNQSSWVGFADEWRDGINSSGDNVIYAAQAQTAGTDIVVTDDGRIGFGTSDPIERFEFRGPGDNDFQITSANTNPPNVIVYNTGGTLDAPGALANNQEVGSFIAKTHDGNGVREIGGVRFYMDGTATPGSTPSRFVVNTTPEGSTSQRQRLIIRENGNVGLSVADPTASLHLRSSDGSANTAPLKLTEGTILSTPEKGAIEFANSHLYFTSTTSTREQLFKGFSDTETINFGTIAAGNMQERNVTIAGASTGDTCNCTPRVRPASPIMWNCFVASEGIVTIRVINPSNTNVSTANAVWDVTVIDF